MKQLLIPAKTGHWQLLAINQERRFQAVFQRHLQEHFLETSNLQIPWGQLQEDQISSLQHRQGVDPETSSLQIPLGGLQEDQIP